MTGYTCCLVSAVDSLNSFELEGNMKRHRVEVLLLDVFCVTYSNRVNKKRERRG